MKMNFRNMQMHIGRIKMRKATAFPPSTMPSQFSAKTKSVLGQAEVDVVGIDKEKVYLVEVAFHEDGLQYGGRLETRDRVCKKLLDIFGLLKFDDLAPVASGGYAAAPFDSPAEPPATAAVPPKANFTGNTAIEFVPPGEGQFRRLLLQKKCAKRTWVYQDGRSRTELWDAHNFTESSNLRGNIQSTNHWRSRKETGLVKVILEIV